MDIFTALNKSVKESNYNLLIAILFNPRRPEAPVDWRLFLETLLGEDLLKKLDIFLSAYVIKNEYLPIILPGFSTNVTRGNLLIGTTWGMGLTARMICLDDCSRAVLRFVSTNIDNLSSSPPSVTALERAAKRVTLESMPSLKGYPNPPEKQLYNLLFELTKTVAQFNKIQVHAPPQLMAQWVCMYLDADKPISFTEIMDRICMAIDGEWVWSGDEIILMPRTNTGQLPTLSHAGCKSVGV